MSERNVSHEAGQIEAVVEIDNLSYNTEYDITINPVKTVNGDPQYGVPYPTIKAKTSCVGR